MENNEAETLDIIKLMTAAIDNSQLEVVDVRIKVLKIMVYGLTSIWTKNLGPCTGVRKKDGKQSAI